MSDEEQYYGVKAGAHIVGGKRFLPGDVVKLSREGYERRKDVLEPAPEARRIKHSGEIRPE